MKKTKKLLLALCATLCVSALGTGVAQSFAGSRLNFAAAEATQESAPTTPKDDMSAYGGIDITPGIHENASGGWISTAHTSNNLVFKFPDSKLGEASSMDWNEITPESGEAAATTWDEYLYLHSTKEHTEKAYSLKEWKAMGKSYRVCSWGDCLVLMFENNSHANGMDIDYITFKSGIKMFAFGSTYASSDEANDWIFTNKCDVPVEKTKFTKDLTLWINRETDTYEYAAESLSIEKTDLFTYITADPDVSDLMMTVKTIDGETKTVAVKKEMCEGDYGQLGNTEMTVSYGGKTVKVPVSVKEAPTELKSIAIVGKPYDDKSNKEGYKIYYKKFSTVATTVENAKLTVTYLDKETNTDKTKEVEVTAAMIVKGCPNNSKSGTKLYDVTIAYTEYGVTKTCTAKAKCTGDIANINKGILYNDSAVVSYNGGRYGTAIAFDMPTSGLAKIDNIAGLDSARIDSNGEIVKLGKLVSVKFAGKEEAVILDDLLADGVNPGFFDNKLVLRGLTSKKIQTKYGEIEYIEIMSGFMWYTSTATTFMQGSNAVTDTYTPMTNNVLTEKVRVAAVKKNGADITVRATKSVALTVAGDYKKSYVIGDMPSLAGLKLEAVYYDDKDEKAVEIPVTADMLEYDFSTAGQKTVKVIYNGKSQDIGGITVTPETVAGIRIKTTGKTKYEFGLDEFDISGYEFETVIKSTVDNSERYEAIDLATVTFTGYNSHNLGEQTVEFSYNGKKVTQKVETEINSAAESRLDISYSDTYTSYENTLLYGMSVHTNLTKIPSVGFRAFAFGHEMPNVADKVKINGILASDLIKMGKLRGISFWTSQIIFFFDTADLQPTDKPQNKDQYIDGLTMLVKTVEFLPGFQLYYTDDDIWWDKAGQWTEADVHSIPNAVVKENVVLENVGAGIGWFRQFKMDEKGNMTADAITVSGLNETVKFNIGDKVTAETFIERGLKLYFKYQDGGEEALEVGSADIEFDENLTATAGKKTVTVYFKDNDHFATFEVEVLGAKQNPEESNVDSGCGSVVAGSLGMSAMLLAGAAVALRKKKKD